MTAKSPTNVKQREVIGEEQFSRRREVFDQHDTVFLPASPIPSPVDMDQDDSEEKTKTFRRTPAYSSMRESRTDDIRYENIFRNRKYSDNFTSDLNQSDDIDYRRSLTERTRRISKLRREFLASNLHEPSSPDPFMRVGNRSTLPARIVSSKYKIESPTVYKFPFAEPYASPLPVRKVVVDLGPIENGVENIADKENEDPDIRPISESVSISENSKLDHHQFFDELVKRYSPQRKPVDWALPPTKPRIVEIVPKNDVVVKNDLNTDFIEHEKTMLIQEKMIRATNEIIDDIKTNNDNVANGADDAYNNNNQKLSKSELDEGRDKVSELNSVLDDFQNIDEGMRPHIEGKPDMTIPDLLEKINHDATDGKKREKKKVKRKRSFLDKLLGRKKEK